MKCLLTEGRNKPGLWQVAALYCPRKSQTRMSRQLVLRCLCHGGCERGRRCWDPHLEFWATLGLYKTVTGFEGPLTCRFAGYSMVRPWRKRLLCKFVFFIVSEESGSYTGTTRLNI